jgi:transcription antitermination factor NusG
LQLQNKDLECFLPLYTAKKPGYDRIRERELPLFPGYLFCRLDPVKRLPVLITPGVLQIVGVAREPIPIDDDEIAAIHGVLQTGRATRPCPYQPPQVAQRVRIENGPLSGLEGVIVRLKNRQRLVVSVTLLQRSIAVEIDDEAAIVQPN